MIRTQHGIVIKCDEGQTAKICATCKFRDEACNLYASNIGVWMGIALVLGTGLLLVGAGLLLKALVIPK